MGNLPYRSQGAYPEGAMQSPISKVIPHFQQGHPLPRPRPRPRPGLPEVGPWTRMEAGTLLSFHTHPFLKQNFFQVEEQARGRCLAQLHFSAGCLGVENWAFAKGPGRVHYRFAGVGKPAEGSPPKVADCAMLERQDFVAERKLKSSFVYLPAWMSEKDRTGCCDLTM